MKRMRTERLTWAQIVERFPNDWVRLEDVDANPDNKMDIRSAIVTRVGEATLDDYKDMVAGKSMEIFTTPDYEPSVGALTI